MWLENNASQERRIFFLDFLQYFLITSLIYWLINFVLTPNTLSPLHEDDYALLGTGYENFSLLKERPISTNIAYLMGEMGPTFSFSILNLLTIVVPGMVLYFFSQLLKTRLSWLLIVAFSVMVFSHHAAFEHGKYLGLITNLSSHFFGCFTLISLLHARQKQTLWSSVLPLITYGLSIFAKEDFLLPPLLLLIYFGADLYFPRKNTAIETVDISPIEKKWWLNISLCFAALVAVSILFNFLTKNFFLRGIIDPTENITAYAVSFSPTILIPSFLKLTFEYLFWQTFVGLLTIIALSVFWKERRREMLLLTVILFSLILPYALIPNNAPSYRIFAWLPWLSAPVVIAATLLWYGKIGKFFNRKTAKVFALLLFLIPFLIAYLDHKPRQYVAIWYQAGQHANKLMLDSLLANKTLLDKEKVVGILNMHNLSPWSNGGSNNHGSYLQKKLGFKNRWIIFVDKNTIFFTIGGSPLSNYLSVVSSQKLCDQPELLIMKFDSSGVGTPLRAKELCATNRASS